MSKLRLLLVADDPDTILSYGILGKMLVDHLHKDYEIHYQALQWQIGIPHMREDKYMKYPARCQGQRNPTNLPSVIKRVRPDIVWTNFDVQVYEKFVANNYIPKDVSWIGWIPWDNHDKNQIVRARKGFGQVDVRIAISQFGYQFLAPFVRMDGFIYNIVDTDNFYPLSDDDEDEKLRKFKKRMPWYNEKDKYLIFVGRPNWRKRMTHMMAIMKELLDRGRDDIKLILHSNIYDPGANANLPEMIDAFKIRNIIQDEFYWDEGISKGDLNCLYNIADLYIAPHGGEGFGMPIGEAMAAGTPFIASDICTTREFAGKNEDRGFKAPVYYLRDRFGRPIPDRGVLRPYPDVVKFADIIEKSLEDEDKLKKMGEEGVKWAREFCSPVVVANKWKEVFDSFDISFGDIVDYK